KALFLAEHMWFVEARQAGIMAGCIAREIEYSGQPVEPPVVLFSGGEMVVSVGEEKGIGGRNQEYALSAAQIISGSKNIIIGSVDTDGTDGPGAQFGEALDGIPSCLAGGVVDGNTVIEAELAGIDIAEELKRHNTSPALWKLGAGVHAVPGISIMDLTAVMVTGKSSQKQSITTFVAGSRKKRNK
ncbi:MOFRL family protein, partial [Chloroflexota bacterium]